MIHPILNFNVYFFFILFYKIKGKKFQNSVTTRDSRACQKFAICDVDRKSMLPVFRIMMTCNVDYQTEMFFRIVFFAIQEISISRPSFLLYFTRDCPSINRRWWNGESPFQPPSLSFPLFSTSFLQSLTFFSLSSLQNFISTTLRILHQKCHFHELWETLMIFQSDM